MRVEPKAAAAMLRILADRIDAGVEVIQLTGEGNSITITAQPVPAPRSWPTVIYVFDRLAHLSGREQWLLKDAPWRVLQDTVDNYQRDAKTGVLRLDPLICDVFLELSNRRME